MSTEPGQAAQQEQVEKMVETLSIEQSLPSSPIQEPSPPSTTQQPVKQQTPDTQQSTDLSDKPAEQKEQKKDQPQPEAESKVDVSDAAQEEEEPQQKPHTKHFVNVNRQSLQFGKSNLYPGSIEELDVMIDLNQDQVLNNNNPLLLRIIAKCHNQEFNDLDEYVFSVRSNERFEYFEEVRFKIRSKERAQVKVAVKVPSVKHNYKISGSLEIQLANLPSISLPMTVSCEVPQIICIKKLFKVSEETWMIKIPAKKNQIRMPPIPFKNISNFNFTMEVQAITHQNFTKRPYDIIVQNFVNCQANTQFFVNIQLKQNMQYEGPMPTKDTIRKILVLKIKGSTVYFNFPLEIFVFESSVNSVVG